MSGSARSQIATNLGFTLIKSAFVLLSIRLADVMLTAQMMGLLLLFRRQGALWSNLVQLGLAQALVRYYVSNGDDAFRARLWSCLLRWMIGSALCFSLILTVFSDYLSPWLFPDVSPGIVVAFGVYVAGLALGFMANASWTSEFKFVESNLIDWAHGSLLFVICLLLGNHFSAVEFAFTLALLTVVASIYSLSRFGRFKGFLFQFQGGSWELPRDVQKYGLTRALTAFADLSTLVVGPWFLRHQPAEAAQVIAAYTILRIAQMLVLPVAQVLALRAISQKLDSRREERRLLIVCAFVFVFSWLGVIAYFEVGALAVQLWVPNSSAGVVVILDSLMLFMPGICLFYALRSHVDLKYSTPWNLITFCAGLILFYIFIRQSVDINLGEVIKASRAMFGVYYVYAAIAILVLVARRT